MLNNIINKAKSYIGANNKTKSSVTEIKGVDASSYQSDISWEKVSKTDVKFAIIRSTTKNGNLDTKFWRNYNGAKTYGLDTSIYHFSYALDTNKATSDAKNLISKLNGEKPVIWLDLEWSEQGKLGKTKVTEIATAFVKTCQSLGYECNIYSNVDWYKNYYNADKLKELGCKFWIARYGVNDGKLNNKYKPNIGEYIWQYTSKGTVNGINGDVDMNIKYENKTSNNISDSTSSSNTSSHEMTKIQKLVKIICVNGVNIRTTPDASSTTNKKGIYSYNDIIEVVGITKNKSWYKDVNGRYFTANSKWVTDLTGIVSNCYHLNVRESANTKGKVVAVIDKNDKVNILKENDNWYYIKTTNGTKGWVFNKYIKLN